MRPRSTRDRVGVALSTSTLEQGLVIRRLGALAAEDQDALRLAIGQILG